MAVRGHKQNGRTGVFPDRSVRATVMLAPGDPDRTLYEQLVADLGVSGAEVLRRGIRELTQREKDRKARQDAADRLNAQQNTQQEELPQTG